MAALGPGRKRQPHRERLTAEDDALNQIAREAEARLAAKRAARAEAREIRMKELERQQKEIYQVQKKYYGLDTKWGDIEQWMENNERYSHRSRRNTSASDEDERISVGSRGSLRGNFSSELGLANSGLPSKSQTPIQNGNRPSMLSSDAVPSRSYRASLYDESIYNGSRRYSAPSSRAPSEYSCYLGSGSRASSRASSARASPVVEERSEKDFIEKGTRAVSSLSAATLASLGGSSSRRGSGDTSISVDTEASIREMKDISELKDQIEDVESKYRKGLKEMKDLLAEAEEKYKKAMVSNAQLDNEKTNFMYQVDTLKDVLVELEEQLAESRRQYEEKSKELERQRYAHSVLQFQFHDVKETLQKREEMLTEIRQLQQEKESYVREISDLQETIEWKDKKIGALERQKEFFDCIRNERDDLRNEVATLLEQLKKHGIILNSEIATNGETSDDLKSEGHLETSAKVNSEISPALKTIGDGHLGRANELEMKNESLEEMGKSEILQSTKNKAHKEENETREVLKAVTEQKTLHHDVNSETKGTSSHDNDLIVTCANNRLEEQISSATECVFSSKSHGISEMGESTLLAFEEVECVCDITKEQSIKKQESSDTPQSQDKSIDQAWELNSEIQCETQTEVQSCDNENWEGSMNKERESCNEEFQDALDFVVNSHGQNMTGLLPLGDERHEGLGTKEIETYNKSVKIVNEEPKVQTEMKNECQNESNAKNNDLGRRHEEECFDMAYDKTDRDKKREVGGMEEESEYNIVQNWEVQNKPIKESEGAGVNSGVKSNEIGPKQTESEKTMIKHSNEYPTEESKGGQVCQSMISSEDHTQENEAKIQVQTMQATNNENKKENESKSEVVETGITQAETPVNYQCSHDINSILKKTDDESVNTLQVDEGEPNQGSSTQGNSELVKLDFEDAETCQTVNQGCESPSFQEDVEKEKQDITVEMDCTVKMHSEEVAKESHNSDVEDSFELEESGQQLPHLSENMSWNIPNIQSTEIVNQSLEATEESDQAARKDEKEEKRSIEESETKNEQNRERNDEITGIKELDNEDKNKIIEMENDLEINTKARQIKEKAEDPEEEIVSDIRDDEMKDQGEKTVEDDGEAFDSDNDISQMKENRENYYVDEANMKTFGKTNEQKSHTDDDDNIAIEENDQSKQKKIETKKVLNKDKNSQQTETEEFQGAEHFQADTYQFSPGLADETEEQTINSESTEETSGNVTKQLDNIHEGAAKSQSKEDVRKDDIADKGSRKGKGKNKEDCLVA